MWAQGGATTVYPDPAEESLSDVASGSGGTIVLGTKAGSLTVTDGIDGDGEGITSAGAGLVSLTATGPGRDVVIDADVVSGTGSLTVISADGDVRMADGRRARERRYGDRGGGPQEVSS